MRLFIAIDLPKEIKGKIIKQTKSLITKYPQVSWVKEENIHLTLKFLGNVDDKLTPDIKLALNTVVNTIKPFKLQFDRFGFFDRRYLIVLFGIDTSFELENLVRQVEKEMAKLGFPKEKRPYSAHVTLGRGKHLSKELLVKIKNDIKILKRPKFSPFVVSEITLMRSTLTSAGSIYTSSARFALLGK